MNKEKLLLLTLAAIQFTNIMDFMIMMPLGPQLMRLFDITPRQFGFIVSSYTFSAGIFGFLGAFFIDRFNRKTAILFTFIGFTIGTIACGIASTYSFLVCARILTGVFGGVLGSLVFSIVGDAIPAERRGQAMGIVMTAFSLASVFGVPFGLYMANKFSWNAPFIFLGVVGFLLSIIIQISIPSMSGHIQAIKPNPLNVIMNIAKDFNQMKALSLMAFLMMGQFSVIPFLSPYMVANVGFTEMELPLIYLMGGLCTFISMPLIGRLSDKLGNAKVFTIFILISSIPIFLVTHMPKSEVAVALVITSFFMVTIGGRMIPAMAMITSTVLPQSRGGFMSINSSIQQLFAGVASYTAGSMIVKHTTTGELINYNFVGYLAIVSSLLCIFIAQTLTAVDIPNTKEKSSPAPTPK